VSKTRISLLVVLMLLIALPLAGCKATGEATATSPAAQALLESARTKDAKEVAQATATPAAEAPAEGEAALMVADKGFTVDELKALPSATASTEDGDFSGASLLAVLEAAGLGADTINLVASDGYSAEVTTAEIDDTAVIVVNDDGTLDTVIPTVAKRSWVKDLVSISVP
jgi:hypothetical protein